MGTYMPNYQPKWEGKLPKIPIIVIQIHYKTQTMENGGEGECRKISQNWNQTCPNRMPKSLTNWLPELPKIPTIML